MSDPTKITIREITYYVMDQRPGAPSAVAQETFALNEEIGDRAELDGRDGDRLHFVKEGGKIFWPRGVDGKPTYTFRAERVFTRDRRRGE